MFVIFFSERYIPRGVTPQLQMVHSVRDLQLFPDYRPRAGLQPLQYVRVVSRATGGHHRVLLAHPLRNHAQDQW